MNVRDTGLLALLFLSAVSILAAPVHAEANGGDYITCVGLTDVQGAAQIAACDRAIRDSDDNLKQKQLLLGARGKLLLMSTSGMEAKIGVPLVKKAIADFDAALALKPDRALASDLYQTKGVALDLLGVTDEAKVAYDNALLFDPDNMRALFHRARARDDAGQKEAALADFERVGELGSADTSAPENTAQAWNAACWIRAAELNRDLKKARADCDKSIALKQDGSAYDSRGMVGLREGNFGMALQDYTEASRLEPTIASTWYGKGIAEIRMGQTEQGRSDIAKALKLDPNIAATYQKLGIAQ